MKEFIAVDWDGTCVEFEWPRQSTTWMPGAVEALHELCKFAKVVVFTARIAPYEPDLQTLRHPAMIQAEKNYIRNMLDEAELYDVELWDKPWKPGATAYVDDRAVHYAGRKTSWANIVPKLAAMCGVKDEIEKEEVLGGS